MRRVSKRLRLLFPLCSPRLVLEITLIFQLCVFMTFSLLLVTPLLNARHLIQKAGNYFPSTTLYFQPYDRLEAWLTDESIPISVLSERRKTFQKQLDTLFPDSSYGFMFSTTGLVRGGSDTQVVAYSRVLLEHMSLPTLTLEKVHGNEGKIPALYRGRNHHAGQSIVVDLNLYNPVSISVNVTDTLDTNTLLILPRYGSTEPTMDYLISHDNYEIFTGNDPGAMLITDIEFLPTDQASLVSSACLIFPNKQIELTESLLNETRRIGGNIFSMADIRNFSNQRNLQSSQTPLARFIASAIFTAVSLTGYVFLNYAQNQRTLGIYAQCGMSARSVHTLYIQLISMIFLLAIIVEMLLLRILSASGVLNIDELSIDTICISLICYFILMFLANVVSHFRIKSLQIIERIREV